MKKIILLIFLSVAINSLYAQQTAVTGGGDISGTAGSVSYSIGQAVYTAIDASSNTLIQGVQQPNTNNTFPVTQLVLKCANQKDKVLLQWKTETEVNSGKNFANLRQIFHSLILAKWYKENLKTALLNQVYSNQNKVHRQNLKRPWCQVQEDLTRLEHMPFGAASLRSMKN